MKLSEKKKREIRDIGNTAFMEVLKKTDSSKEVREGWHNLPPEEWRDGEKFIWEMLTELEMKITHDVIELLSGKDVGS